MDFSLPEATFRGHAGQILPGADAAGDARIIRRVTLRLIPFLMLCYVIANLNRVNLSFAALQMNHDLRLSATTYGFGAGVFFITYCLCEIPSNLMLHKFGASRWIARIMVSWGVRLSPGRSAFLPCACCWARPRRGFIRACCIF